MTTMCEFWHKRATPAVHFHSHTVTRGPLASVRCVHAYKRNNRTGLRNQFHTLPNTVLKRPARLLLWCCCNAHPEPVAAGQYDHAKGVVTALQAEGAASCITVLLVVWHQGGIITIICVTYKQERDRQRCSTAVLGYD